MNLIENAIRYTPTGSPIEIKVQTHEETMLISVADHGPGIPPSDIENIFEKFYRVNPGETAVSGTGLGLAIVQEIIQQHGGAIHVQSKVGEGSIFTVSLPQLQQFQ